MDPLDMTDIKQVIGELVLQVYQRDKALLKLAPPVDPPPPTARQKAKSDG